MAGFSMLGLALQLGRRMPTPKRPRGRPKKPTEPWSFLPSSRRVPKQSGPRPIYDLAELVRRIDARLADAKREGRTLTDRPALREMFAEALKQRYPRRYRELANWRDHYVSEEGLSPEQALSRAFSRKELRAERTKFETLAKALSNARKRR